MGSSHDQRKNFLVSSKNNMTSNRIIGTFLKYIEKSWNHMDFYESPMKKKPWTDFEVADSAMLGPPGSFAVPETFQIFLPLGCPGCPRKIETTLLKLVITCHNLLLSFWITKHFNWPAKLDAHLPSQASGGYHKKVGFCRGSDADLRL